MIIRIEDTYEQVEEGGFLVNRPRSMSFARKVQTVESIPQLIVDCWVDDVEAFLVSMGNPNVLLVREQ